MSLFKAFGVLFKSCIDDSMLRILQVLELPEDAELLASSRTAPYEIWSFQDRALAIQGHPEMVPEDMLQKIWPFLSSNGCVAPSPLSWSPHDRLPWEFVGCVPG